MEQKPKYDSGKGQPIGDTAISEVESRSRYGTCQRGSRVQQFGMNSRHSEIPNVCLLRRFRGKGQNVVLQIARSAGWGGQKAEPTTSKPTSREETARGATPYPPGIPYLSCRVQKTVSGRAGANASAARSLATHFNGPMLITL